jgi:hypothetical protein
MLKLDPWWLHRVDHLPPLGGNDQPGGGTPGEIAALRAEIATLRAEIAALKAIIGTPIPLPPL